MASSATSKIDLTIAGTQEDAPSRPDSTAPIAPSHPPDIPISPNPWDDVPAASKEESTPENAHPKPVHTLDPSVYKEPTFAGLNAALPTPEPKNEVKKEILSEFDPLVSQEEQAARDAWETTEGHPPPPRTPSPPMPPMKDLHIMSPTSPDGPSVQATSPGPSAAAIASPTSFPSFAAFARSFSIPLVRSRPQSFDGSAKVVPSPSTLSSFAAQQETTQDERPDASKAIETEPVSTQTGSGTSSPVPKPVDGGFDFQKFLDQMKTRSADPVSKYLRSCVYRLSVCCRS